MHQKSSPNTSFFKTAIVLLTAVLVIAGSYMGIKTYFKVRNLEINEKKVPKGAAQLKGFNTLGDYNLLLSSSSTIADFLKRSNPTVKTIEVQKKYPDRLIITLTFYTPFASLKGIQGYFIISSDATVLASTTTPAPTLPQVSFYQLLNLTSYGVGSKLDFADIKSSLIFLQSSLDLGLKTTKIDINGSHMIALYADKQKILFSQEKDIDLQKYQFETIIKKLKEDKKSFQTLDVRFDKPIIVF